MSFSGLIGGIGAFAAGEELKQGYDAAAASLDKAASMEDFNVKLEAASGDLQKYGLLRQYHRALGETRAVQTGNGFTFQGSALDLDQSSTSQFAQGRGIISDQTAINQQGYAIQAEVYRGEAALDRAQGSAAETNGIFSAISGVIGMFG